MFGVRLFGRRLTRLALTSAALYYAAFWPSARRSSKEYLARVGRAVSFGEVVRHLWCFAVTVMDRLLFVQDRFDDFEIHRHGHEHLVELIENKRGAILLGAHLGSFEVMRTQSVAFDIPINIVGDFGNAEMINGVLRRLNPRIDARLINARDGGLELALKVREAVERGELVAILGDRTRDDTDTVTVDFLGGKATLPTGPYALASVLGCPVYFTVAVHTAPNRYDLYCEPFAESIRLPRGRRQEALMEYVQRYANRLEHYCHLAPHNWFNFFDFWRTPPSPAAS